MARTRDVLDDLAEWYDGPGSSAAAGDSGFAAGSLLDGLPRGGIRSAALHGLCRIAEVFLTWHDRARARRALAALSDDTLRDIGVSRAAARGEAARPLWRS